MNQLLLSSQRLSQQKVLASGSINIFELLQKHGTDNIQLQADVPPCTLELEWKEIATPSTSNAMRDLVGKKMASYKFQYLGQFKYNGQLIAASNEVFSSAISGRSIQNHSIEGDGWVNCTWLIDLLMNAAATPNEQISWSEEANTNVLVLRTSVSRNKDSEQQKIIFSKDFDRLEWMHNTVFAG